METLKCLSGEMALFAQVVEQPWKINLEHEIYNSESLGRICLW